MTISVEKVSSNKVKIRFEADAQAFEEAMQQAYLKNRGRINVPGFRKGKAPRKLIENMYGEGVFYDDAFESMFPAAYDQAVKENDLHPVDRPSVDLEQIGSGQNLIFTAEVFVRPEVTLGEYKGVSVHKHEHPVTDDQINQEIDRAREKVSRMVQVEDRAVENGDIVNLDYMGTVDGVAFAGGTAQGQQLTIGSGQFIPGFEEQMIGLKIGEERDLSVAFPKEYHSEEMAGKDAVFHVKVNGIEMKELPELNDDFARDVSEFDTLDAYKADIRAKLEADAAKHADDAFENAVVEAVVKNAAMDVPEPMIERQVDDMLRDFEMRLRYQGLRLEDFLKYSGQSIEMMRGQYKPQAEARVKAELVLEAVQKAENIQADEQEIDQEIEKYAQQTKKGLEEIKATLSESDLNYFRDIAAMQKTLRLLKDQAKAEVCEGC